MDIQTEVCEQECGGRTISVVQCAGDLDAFTSFDLRETVVRLIEEGARDIIIDLARVAFIDSVGIGTLVGCGRHSDKHRGSYSLICQNGGILKALDITGLSEIFNVFFSLEQAILRDKTLPGRDGEKNPRWASNGGTSIRVARRHRGLDLTLCHNSNWLFGIEVKCNYNQADRAVQATTSWADEFCRKHNSDKMAESLPSEVELGRLLSAQVGHEVQIHIFKPE